MEVELPSLKLRIEQAARDLELYGYAVIKQVLSEEVCAQTCSEMWDCLAKASHGELTKETDYSKKMAKDMPSHKHGISEIYRLNHAPPIRALRCHPAVLEIYCRLYGSKQLTSSMDRVNFKFPGRRYKSQGDWPHLDQNPRLLGRVTIQSYITLKDAPEEAPGNRLYEGSHLLFAERWAYMRKADYTDGWQMLTETEANELGQVCPLVKPVLQKGDMLLWDSRTVHSPSDGTDFSDGRFVVYLCYNRLWEKANDTKFWAKKKEAFLDCRATSHRPVPQNLFGKYPRAYGGVQPAFSEFSKEDLGITDEPNDVERLLFGFDKYTDERHLLPNLVDCTEPLLKFVSPFTPLVPGEKSIKKPALKKVKLTSV